jgi:hypothetical protein
MEFSFLEAVPLDLYALLSFVERLDSGKLEMVYV